MRLERPRVGVFAMLAACGAMVLCAPLAAQDQPQDKRRGESAGESGGAPAAPKGSGGGEGASEGELRREFLRRRLAERIEELRAEQKRIDQAMKAIDEGKPIDDVLSALPRGERRGEWWRDGRWDEREGPRDRDEREGGPGPSDREEGGRERRGQGEGSGLPWRNEEERRAFMQFLNEAHPEIAARVEKAAAEDPERFREMVARVPGARDVMRMIRDHPDRIAKFARTMRLDREARGLAYRAAFGAEAERVEARAQLRAAVDELFDARIDMSRIEIEKLQGRITELTEEIRDHLARRSEVVDQRTQAMVDEAQRRGDKGGRDGPGWSGAPGEPGQAMPGKPGGAMPEPRMEPGERPRPAKPSEGEGERPSRD